MKYYRNITWFSLLLLIPFGAGQAVGVHTEWTSEGVVLSQKKYFNPEIIQVSDTLYRMFFEDSQSIRSATSSDGLAWSVEDDTRIEQAVMPTFVKLDDGTWRMYFVRQVDGVSVVMSATSEDGETFVEEDGIRLEPGHSKNFDQYGIKHPSVVQLANGSFRMYYDTMATEDNVPNNHVWRIVSAISEDGLTWTHDNGVRINPSHKKLKADAVWSPAAVYDETSESYSLYFTAEYNAKPLTRNGIYVATSSNGKKFTVDPNPIVYRDSKTGKKKMTKYGLNGAPQDPFFFDFGKTDRLYYWIVNKGILSAARTEATGDDDDEDEDDGTTNEPIEITSSAFSNNGTIPVKYSCEGVDVSPPLNIANAPSGTKSFALILDDPDAPDGTWLHWTMWDIDPSTTTIAEATVPESAVEGTNDFGDIGYGGPCPPEGDAAHHYYFRLYALDKTLNLEAGTDRATLDDAMTGHILEQDNLIGLYSIE